ncbi:MAG: peptidase S53, partial [Acidobacteria bacterium]|nr:peptidase S53 [Acidobacteriota bacterium]
MRKWSVAVFVVVLAFVFVGLGFANAPRQVINNNDVVILQGNVPHMAMARYDIGSADPALPMEHMILTLKLSPEKQAALDRFLSEVQDPESPVYHQWLTPEQFGERFGPSAEQIAVVTGWLRSQGFQIDQVAKGRTWINFSGTAADVEGAFHTEIHDYLIDGKLYHSNDRDPAIPRALAGVVGGVVSLNSFPLRALNHGFKPVSPNAVRPDYTSGTSHYLAPEDFATIYNVDTLYSQGIDGSGQTIAIVGRTHIPLSDITTFRSTFGLPANDPQIIINGTDPGDLGANEDGEADLDVEWSGAVAKNATIKFVVSKSTSTTDGVDLSAQYIVDNNIAPIMSVSFGQCESSMGSTENSFYNNLWSQASSQGITVFVSSGDSGASGCDAASASTGTGTAVSGLCSTPYNVCVGGTEFMDTSDPSTYWASTNASGTQDSALSYIPEEAWNESGNVSGGQALWASGGGESSVYSKPSWQVAPGVPSDGHRDVPDVALTAASHDGYLVESGGSLGVVGGTSAASPSFAGLMALVVQKTGQRQGNANTRFYQMGNAQYGSSGATIFHDVTTGNNSVPGVTGYSAGPGYDLVTGLGSVDANALVNGWASSTTTTYSISGTVTENGSGLSGVTVTAGSKSATTSTSGSYTISGLANGTYTVTPSKDGYTFTPASQSVTISSANKTGIDFTAAASGGSGTPTEQISDGTFEGGLYGSSNTGSSGT